MINKDKDRVIATIPKDKKEQLEEMSKKTGLTKSILITLALTGLFEAGIKLGDTIADNMMKGNNEE